MASTNHSQPDVTLLLDTEGVIREATFASSLGESAESWLGRPWIETVESLAVGDRLDPIQTAFLENAAFQCGFCTPGFIMMTRELLDRIPDPSDDEIRHYLSGNLCRCAAYPEIVTAVRSAARERATTKA